MKVKEVHLLNHKWQFKCCHKGTQKMRRKIFIASKLYAIRPNIFRERIQLEWIHKIHFHSIGNDNNNYIETITHTHEFGARIVRIRNSCCWNYSTICWFMIQTWAPDWYLFNFCLNIIQEQLFATQMLCEIINSAFRTNRTSQKHSSINMQQIEMQWARSNRSLA